MMPSDNQIFNNDKNSVIDASVIKIGPTGNIHLKTHTLIHGKNRPTQLVNTSLSCTGGSPSLFGVKANKRYIIITQGNNMYEESSYFEVFKKNGQLKFDYQFYNMGTISGNKELSIKQLKSYIMKSKKAKKYSHEK